MNNLPTTAVTTVPTSELITPPVVTPVDAEVDIEILRAIPKQFAITDEKSANWLVRKVNASRQYITAVKEWAEAEQRRAAREEATLMFLFGRQLERWAKSEIEKLNGRRKSLNLPAGCVGFRTVNPCLRVDDEQVVMTWAKSNCPAAIVIVEKLSRTVLKEQFERSGEVPDGATVDLGGERFYVK